jgi:hypothetical protein
VGITDPAELRALVRQQDGGRAQVITLALGLGQNFPGVELLKALAADNKRHISTRGPARHTPPLKTTLTSGSRASTPPC